MTIQEVPTDILSESVIAMQDLRRKYLGVPMVTAYAAIGSGGWAGCPLCLFAESNILGECLGCPWVWITGDDCGCGNYKSSTAERNIARIDQWESTIKAELAKRGDAESCALAEAAEKEGK